MRIATIVIAALTSYAAEACGQSGQDQESKAVDPSTTSFLSIFRAWALVDDSIKAQLPAPATLRSELMSLFTTNGCDLPQRLVAKLKQTTNEAGVIPPELIGLLGRSALDGQLQKFPDRTANAVLHTVTVPSGADSSRQLSLVGAESYRKRSASDFIDSEATDFAYTMDCAGYLSAALSTKFEVPMAQLSMASEGALKNQRAMIVMRGHVFSPAAAAMNPAIGGAALTDRQRVDLLYAIIAEVISDGDNRKAPASDDTPVTAWRKIDAVWTSNSGTSSMTGKASIAGSGNVGAAGLASVSASVGAGGAVSRQITFKSFNTYILDSKVLEPVQRKLGRLKILLKDEIRRLRPSTSSTVDSRIEILYPEMPEIPCKLPWIPSTSTNTAPGSAMTSWTDAGCKVTFTKVAGLADKSVLEMKAMAFDTTELAFFMPLP